MPEVGGAATCTVATQCLAPTAAAAAAAGGAELLVMLMDQEQRCRTLCIATCTVVTRKPRPSLFQISRVAGKITTSST